MMPMTIYPLALFEKIMTAVVYDKFIYAVQMGLLDDVKRLIPLCDPKQHDSEALWHAATIGDVECLKLLIPVCNPKASNSLALQCALYYQHNDCVVLLHPLSNAKKALRFLGEEYDHIDWAQRLDSILAQHQHSVLERVARDTTHRVLKTQPQKRKL